MLSISQRVTFFVVHFNNAIPLESVVQTSGPGAMCSQQCSHPENVSTAMGEFTKPFLVACYATLHPALSVGWSVCLSVTFYFFYDFYVYLFCDLTAPAQMILRPQIWPTRLRLG